MLTLSFDTATDVATSALVEDGDVRGERTSVPRTLLEDVDAERQTENERITGSATGCTLVTVPANASAVTPST